MQSASVDAFHIAQVVHGVNNDYRRAIGEAPKPEWHTLDARAQRGLADAVETEMRNPARTPEENHDKWLDARLEEGWSYGQQFDAVSKQHPNIIPYAELPREQQAKDFLFRAIVRELSAFVRRLT